MNKLNPANWSPLRRIVTLAVIILAVIVGGIWVSVNSNQPGADEVAPVDTAPMTATANPTAGTGTATPEPTQTSSYAPVDTKSITTAAEKNATGFITAYLSLTPGMSCPQDWLAGLAPHVQGGMDGAQKMFGVSDAGAPTQQGCDDWSAKNDSRIIASAYASAEYVNNQVQAYAVVETTDKKGVKSTDRAQLNLNFDPATQLITGVR